MTKPTIWLLEDDLALSEILGYNLREAGYSIVAVDNESPSRWPAEARHGDLVVFDRPWTASATREFCQQLRAADTTRDLVIIVLSSRGWHDPGDLPDLRIGADDYIAKPFRVARLLERIELLLAMGPPPHASDQTLISQGLLVDPQRKLVQVGEQSVPLTRSERQILHVLMRQPGRAWDRQGLIETALGDEALILERTIDVHIRAMRRKLDSLACLIETVRGIGYRFHDPRWQAPPGEPDASHDDFDDEIPEEIDSPQDGH